MPTVRNTKAHYKKELAPFGGEGGGIILRYVGDGEMWGPVLGLKDVIQNCLVGTSSFGSANSL